VKIKPNITINGQLDRLEILDHNLRVNVVDYKTGKPRSRNVLEGKTKGATGDYKRQLVFYNLLLNNYAGGKYKMVSGEIDFLEPDDRDNYHKEKFVIQPAEVKELEGLIIKTSDEIMGLKFWDKRCNDEECEYCRLRKSMDRIDITL